MLTSYRMYQEVGWLVCKALQYFVR